jgi:hypothetical protein
MKRAMYLQNYAVMGMLVTPTATGCDRNTNYAQGGTCLKNGLMNQGLLPTPRANQVNGCDLNSENLANRNKGNLEEHVAKWVTQQETGKTSQLNPQFVMEMMGFPPDWTLLPFLSGETSQSRAVETP